MIDAINPFKDKEIRAFDGSLIVVDARFLRINRDEVVENLMVIFEDRTGIREAEQKLEDERERYDTELEAIAAILKNGPPLFRDFITEGEALVEKLYISLDKLGESDTSAHFMREFHSLKGSARSLQLDRLATSAHRIEDLLIAAREQGSFGSEERQAILKSAGSVKQGILNIRESIERFSDFSGKDAVIDISGRGVGLDVVKDTVRQLGGTIRVQTKLGGGTSFLLTIPLKRGSDRAPAP